MLPDSFVPSFSKWPVLNKCIVPLSDVQVKYYDWTSNDKSLIVVGVVPRLNSANCSPVVVLKILIKVPYIISDKFKILTYLLRCCG